MTIDEAIKIISQMIKDEEGFLSDNTVEAHKMAIQALEQEIYANIPFLLHKEFGCPLDECVKAYDVAIDYLRSQGKVKG